MTFQDLQEALARLAGDPRIHPNTPVKVEEGTYGENQATRILIQDHTLVIAANRREPAVVRA